MTLLRASAAHQVWSIAATASAARQQKPQVVLTEFEIAAREARN
ncbi:hypothetical protein [Mycobacterium sp.]|nr:hypothetical protein [Mycobacterium sp.]HKP44150.1 hypothetical protein [Mycobacterium sp.]